MGADSSTDTRRKEKKKKKISITCHMPPVTCHLSPTQTATDRPPGKSPTMHYGLCTRNKTKHKFSKNKYKTKPKCCILFGL